MRNQKLKRPFKFTINFLLLQGCVIVFVALVTCALAVGQFSEVIAQHLWFSVVVISVWVAVVSAGLFVLIFNLRPVKNILASESNAYRTLLEEFTRSLSLITDFDGLLDNQIRKIGILTDSERLCILVASESGEDYTLRTSRGFTKADVDGITLQHRGDLVRWLHTNETHLIPSENRGLIANLLPTERDLLNRLNVTGILPLVTLNRLVGIVFISKENALTPDQIETVRWFTPQVALAIANAILYEQQRIRMSSLYRAERLAITGQLAAGAAHEIRNPLASIRSTIQYLRSRLTGDSESADMMGMLVNEADRIETIVKGMLSFARPEEPKLEVTNLAEVATQVVSLVEPTAHKAKVKIETHFPHQTAEILADKNQLGQVFLNVLLNALQAMPDGGLLSIRVVARGSAGMDGWQVEVSDTGSGIPDEQLESIFDPFFTTKKKGTGLGLSISHSIIRSHGGRIDVESAVGKGTRVIVRFS